MRKKILAAVLITSYRVNATLDTIQYSDMQFRNRRKG